MRVLTVGEAALMEAAGQASRMRVLLVVGSTEYDLCNLEGEDWLVSVSVDESQDERFARAAFTVKREIHRKSLAQLMSGSKLAALEGEPLIKPGRVVVVQMAIVARGVTPVSGDWREIFRGDIVSSNWADSTIQVEALDMGHRLVRRFLEAERQYGSPSGVAAETVMQQIIDDAHGARYSLATNYATDDLLTPPTHNGFYYVIVGGDVPAGSHSEPTWPTTVGDSWDDGLGFEITCVGTVPTLYVPASPGFVIVTYKQQREPAWEAIQKIAMLFGWDLRYRWLESSSQFRLTLRDPDRAKAGVDYTWYPDPADGPSYLGLRNVSVGWEDVRNVIPVTFTNASTGARETVTVFDGPSIAKYERRAMPIAEDAASQINTTAEATAMANAILADLKDPLMSHEADLPLFYAAQLGDRYTFAANGVHYDSAQTVAVAGITHQQAAGKAGITTVKCRGTPVASVIEWLRIEARPGIAPPPITVGPNAPTNVEVSKVVGGLVVTWDPPAVGDATEYQVHISKTAAFAITAGTLACGVSANRAELGDLDPGDTYYCKVVPVDGSGNVGSASAEVSVAAGYVTPAAMGHGGFAAGFMPPNGNLLLLDAAGAPDGWVLSGPVSPDSFSRTGDKSLKFDSTGPASAWSKLFPVPGGGRAVVRTLYYQDVAPSGAWYDRVAVYFFAADKTTSLSFSDKQLPLSVGAWGADEMWVDVPSTARYAYVLFGAVGSSHNHNVWLDEIQLEYQQPGVWTAPTLTNSWANYGGSFETAGYWKDSTGVVHIKGAIKSGTLGLAAFTLPAGFRPSRFKVFPAYCYNGAAQVLAHVSVNTDGTVKPTGGSNVEFWLDGITFRAD